MVMITVDEIYACLQEEESPVLEFKRDWYWTNASSPVEISRQWGEFLKDIISLCNSYVGYCGIDRYLIVGFGEADKKVYPIDISSIKKLSDLKLFKKDLLARLEKIVNTPPLNIEIETVLIDGHTLLAFKIPSPTSITEIKNNLDTKTLTVMAGVVLVRKGQDNDSVRAASTEEIAFLVSDFSKFKDSLDKKPKPDQKRDRSIKSTVELYIDKNRSLSIEKDFPVSKRDWSENVLFELYRLNQKFSNPTVFLYIHENAAQNKTFEHIKREKLTNTNDTLIVLTERPSELKDLGRRKSNLKARFQTEHVFFIDEFGYKNLYSEYMLDYQPYRLENYVEGVADIGSDEKKKALDQLKDWYGAVSNPLMVIKGYGGIGKTTLVKQFLDHVHDHHDDVGILFIDSNEIVDELIKIARSDHNIDDIYDFYLAQMKKKDFDGKGFSKELLKLSVDNGNLLIVLDGIDEVIAKLGTGFDVSSFITSISESYTTNLEKTKIIITCRDYFWDTLEYKTKVEEITLEPFSEDLAAVFFQKYFAGDQAKISKALKMASEFRLSSDKKDSDLIYIPYVLDMIGYLIKQHSEFGGHNNVKAKARLLSPAMSNDFLVLSVCEREVTKLGNFSIDDQVGFLINLAIQESGYVTDYNIKNLSNCDIDDLTIEKLKAHPLLRYSHGKINFRYDFFYEYFKGLYIYSYYLDLNVSKLDDKLIELIGSYLRYGNQLCSTLSRKLEYSDSLVYFTMETVEQLNKLVDFAEPSEKSKYLSAISSCFVMAITLLIESGDKKFDSSSATDLLTTIFGDSGGGEISGVALINILAGDSKKLTFDLKSKTIRKSHFERYDFFWDCAMDENTHFVTSNFYQLEPRKGLRPAVIPSFEDCDTIDIQHVINKRIEEENEQSERITESLKKVFELFKERGNFYPQKQQYIKSKIVTNNLLPTLLKNGVIEDYTDDKKPTLRQYRVSNEYRNILKFIDQGTPCIELDRVLSLFK
jgi:hypothetical protein